MLLLARTVTGMASYPTIAEVEAAGYESIGDGGRVGYEHFVNWSYLSDGQEFDPTGIESIVAKNNGDGTKTVVSALYILETGKTMADVPDIAGELTSAGFHDHQNLCFTGNRLVGTLNNGQCPPGSVLRPTPPMIHVWLIPHPCGPFGTVEGHGDPACGSHH